MPRAVVAVRPTQDRRPAASATNTPVVAPPITEPTRNQLAVQRKRCPRPDSASGVMVESIDRPHGDQVERTAAATAVTAASPTSNANMAESVVRVSWAAGTVAVAMTAPAPDP